MNGNTGWTTEASGAASVDAIRGGKFRIPKPRALKKSETAAAAFQQAADDTDLPF